MLLEDGTVVSDDFLRGWFEAKQTPSVDGKALFDPSNPARLLRRVGADSVLRPPYLRFDNGDVLAGRVVAYDAGLDQGGATFTVLLPQTIGGLGERDQRDDEVRVLAKRVAWIAWGEGDAPRQHGLVRFADGSELGVEALSWTPTGVRALAGDRVVTASFEELALVSPPGEAADAETAAQRQVIPGATGEDRVATVLLTNGSILTYAVDQLQSKTYGKKQDHESWHWVQPVWADERVGYSLAGVAAWSFRAAAQLPISVLPAKTVYQHSAAGHAWSWRTNASVQDRMLASGAVVAPRGVGMHANCAVAFALPDSARALTGLVGIDEAVGGGGCAIAAVHLDDRPRVSGKPDWRSGYLLGGQDPVAFGPIGVGDKRYAVLVADDAHDGRPDGADPFDIRDQLNWLSPLVKTDGQRAPPTVLIPALDGWEVEGDLVIGRAFDTQEKRWRATLHTNKQGVVLRRKLTVNPLAMVLDVGVATAGGKSGHELKLMLGGDQVPTARDHKSIQLSGSGEFSPVGARFFLDDHLGESVTLTLRITQPTEQVDPGSVGLIVTTLALRSAIDGRPKGWPLTPSVPLLELEPVDGWPEKDFQRFPLDPEGGAQADQEQAPVALRMHGLTWDRGFAGRANMELAFEIPPGARRFVAVVGWR
ncbi:MAG: hypothetical protein GVY24_04215, partial [Planctomycetes bacterium]|nr:hypothetical protein [Planctomycetota bacterium]